MPIAPSSTDRSVPAAVLAVGADTLSLVRFRAAGLRTGRAGRLLAGVGAAVAVTGWTATAPAYLELPAGLVDPLVGQRGLAAAYAAFVVLALVSAVAAGGGRELLPRDQAVAFPVTPATDHAGALLMAPLNIAWLAQAWLLLAATAHLAGPAGLLPAQAVTLAFLAAGTALAQLLAWSVEAVRRGRHGRYAVAGVTLVIALPVASAAVAGPGALWGALPTARLAAVTAAAGREPGVAWSVAGALVVAAVGLAVAGARPARLAARRPPRDENRVETRTHPPRRDPGSDRAALLRLDRAGVWRSLPLRRGLLLLALLPAGAAAATRPQWEVLVLMPGLVASGAALLFGVNAWCLEGRGGLWRETQPVDPGLTFDVRARLLAELLLGSASVTVAVGALGAGPPTSAQLAAVASALAVIVLQVVAASMRWSVRAPYAVDLRSARAIAAPPVVMLGYSARLAVSTTLTGLLFAGLATVADWWIPPLFAVPFLAWSGWRLRGARRSWLDARVRARVVSITTA